MTDNKQYPPLPDFEEVEQHIYGLSRGYIPRGMLEPIHDLMRAYVDADRAMRAELAAPQSDAEIMMFIYMNSALSGERPLKQQWDLVCDLVRAVLAAAPEAAPASQDAEDAARYRYLKSIAVQTADPLGPIFSIVIRRIDQDGVWGNVSATIDAHIAAARGAQGESNGRD